MSNIPKHTPGPWEAHFTSVYQAESAKKVNEYSREIAFRLSRHMPPEQQVANARLIAAAPELLEALKDSIAWFLGAGSDNDNHTMQRQFLYEKGLKAIAKAEGK